MAYRFGLIGEHIASSLSPVLFSWAFQHTGTSGSYTLFDFPRRLARSFLLRARVDWDGLNVTAPHKDLAYTLCDELSETARNARAVNSLLRKQGKLIGYNTDVAGFRYALEQKLEEVSRVDRVLVIGTGGAARACMIAISQVVQPHEIAIASRRPAEVMDRIAPVLPAPYSPVLLSHSKARQRIQHREFRQHHSRLMKRTDEVFCGLVIDAGFAADRRIHHSQKRSRSSDPSNAAQVDARNKPAEVSNHAAA